MLLNFRKKFCNFKLRGDTNDVRTGAYPEDKHGFHMDERELDKFLNELEKV